MCKWEDLPGMSYAAMSIHLAGRVLHQPIGPCEDEDRAAARRDILPCQGLPPDGDRLSGQGLGAVRAVQCQQDKSAAQDPFPHQRPCHNRYGEEDPEKVRIRCRGAIGICGVENFNRIIVDIVSLRNSLSTLSLFVTEIGVSRTHSFSEIS